jgi:hypothetical protein
MSADNSVGGDANTFSDIAASSADSQAFAHPIALLTVLLTALLVQPSTALQLNVDFPTDSPDCTLTQQPHITDLLTPIVTTLLSATYTFDLLITVPTSLLTALLFMMTAIQYI